MTWPETTPFVEDALTIGIAGVDPVYAANFASVGSTAGNLRIDTLVFQPEGGVVEPSTWALASLLHQQVTVTPSTAPLRVALQFARSSTILPEGQFKFVRISARVDVGECFVTRHSQTCKLANKKL